MQGQIDAVDVSEVQRVLHLGSGQEEVGHAHHDLRIGDLLDLVPRVVEVLALALPELLQQPAVHGHRAREIGLRSPLAVLERDHATLAFEPHPVRVEGVVVPRLAAADLDGLLEALEHFRALAERARLAGERAGQQVVEESLLLRLRDVEGVAQDADRNSADREVVALRLPARPGKLPDDPQVALPRQ